MDLTKMCSIGVVCLGFLTSCDKVLNTDPDPPKKDPAEEAYPVGRLIADKKGRNIDVMINGKGPNSIRFIRKSDGKEYQYLISDLSPKDIAFVGGLPRNLLSKMRVVRPTPPYIVSREKELGELKHEEQNIIRKLKGSFSKLEERSLRAELRRLKPRIEKIEAQIEDYRLKNPED